MFLKRLSALHKVFAALAGHVFLCRSGDNGASSEHPRRWHLQGVAKQEVNDA